MSQEMDKLIAELKQIGFSGFIHLRKDQRDGKKRWTWTYPIENEMDWFLVLLVEKDGGIVIERLENPLGKTFEANQITELISYIRTEILKQ